MTKEQFVFGSGETLIEFDAEKGDAAIILRSLNRGYHGYEITFGHVEGPQFQGKANSPESYQFLNEEIDN